MRTIATVVIFWTCALVFTGCGSSEELAAGDDGSDYIVSYQSNWITLQEQPQEWMLTMRAVTGCAELPCRPARVQLIFESRPDRPRYGENHRLQIEGGGLRLEWPGPSYDAPVYAHDGTSQRIRVEISFAHFREIVFADTLEGRLGPTIWELSYEQRASLRSMIRQLE